MERSVNDEPGQLIVQRTAAPSRLSLGGFDSNDDVAEQVAAEFGPLPFQQRKGEDIRGAILTPKTLVQLCDLSIRYQAE
jgi:hypothetical protein